MIWPEAHIDKHWRGLPECGQKLCSVLAGQPKIHWRIGEMHPCLVRQPELCLDTVII